MQQELWKRPEIETEATFVLFKHATFRFAFPYHASVYSQIALFLLKHFLWDKDERQDTFLSKETKEELLKARYCVMEIDPDCARRYHDFTPQHLTRPGKQEVLKPFTRLSSIGEI